MPSLESDAKVSPLSPLECDENGVRNEKESKS